MAMEVPFLDKEGLELILLLLSVEMVKLQVQQLVLMVFMDLLIIHGGGWRIISGKKVLAT